MWRTVLWGTQWGQLDSRCEFGEALVALRSASAVPGRLRSGAVQYHTRPRSRGDERACSLDTIDTWLILPVVICLSQRLSHACLSISKLYRETANGSLNQLSFI
jgi:hypothetical protein